MGERAIPCVCKLRGLQFEQSPTARKNDRHCRSGQIPCGAMAFLKLLTRESADSTAACQRLDSETQARGRYPVSESASRSFRPKFYRLVDHPTGLGCTQPRENARRIRAAGHRTET